MDSLPSAERESTDPADRRYAVVITRLASTYSARVPDLPGCAAVCRTRAEVEHVIQRTIAGHIAGLVREGRPVPEPRSDVTMVHAG